MTTGYIDSSAAVKLLLADENGIDAVQEVLVGTARIATSRLTYVETLASLAAARRAGRLSVRDHVDAIGGFERIWAEWDVHELTPDLAQDAGMIAETFGLRAGDSIQLATVRRLRSAPVVMLVWDARLRAAAVASGLVCYPPTI